MNTFLCFAHRGASGHEPENTLRSVEKAIELGAHWVEIDVYAVSGELVVIHDERLERTTNGTGHVTKQSLDYLRSLDAGKGEHIPFLREVIDLVSRRAGINVELKVPDAAQPVISLIDEYVRARDWTYEEFLVSSFDHTILKQVKSLQPKIRIGPLITKLPPHNAQFAEDMDAYSVHVKMKAITREFVEDAHRRDLKLFVYTVNSLEDLARMRSMGVDGVFTDYPERVVSPAR